MVKLILEYPDTGGFVAVSRPFRFMYLFTHVDVSGLNQATGLALQSDPISIPIPIPVACHSQA